MELWRSLCWYYVPQATLIIILLVGGLILGLIGAK